MLTFFVMEADMGDGAVRSLQNKDFEDPAQVKFDKSGNDAKHWDLVQLQGRGGDKLPRAQGDQPIKQPQGVIVKSLKNGDWKPGDLNWFDTKYSDAGAKVLTQGGAIIYAEDAGETFLDVPLNDNTFTAETYFKDPTKIFFDKAAFDAFRKNPEHRALMERMVSDGVTLPEALRHAPIELP
jgi:hypothetical protein